MSSTTKLSLQEFLDIPQDDLIYELKEGAAIAKMAPKRFHSRLTCAFHLLLHHWSQTRGEVGIEWAVTLQRNGEDWVPVPDLLYISYDKLPRERFADEACPIPPDLVIEIISPGQLLGDLISKATDYLLSGVSRVWLVDSIAKTITIFYPDSPPQTKRNQDIIKDEILPELEFSVNDIFQQAGI